MPGVSDPLLIVLVAIALALAVLVVYMKAIIHTFDWPLPRGKRKVVPKRRVTEEEDEPEQKIQPQFGLVRVHGIK